MTTEIAPLVTLSLTAPLFTDWSEQYVRLSLPGVAVGTPLRLTINGQEALCQYTGETSRNGAEVLVRLSFSRGERKELVFRHAETGDTELTALEISLDNSAAIGIPGREIYIPVPAEREGGIIGPFAGFAGYPMTSLIRCDAAYEGATLAKVNDGPLFIDYRLDYRFADHRAYTLRFRCFRHEPYIEVSERMALRMGSELVWTLNPEHRFDRIISRDSFESESQPTVEPLGEVHPRDVLCRLQMPVLSNYAIPNNRGWFAFCDSAHPERGMLGVLGLYGARWEQPVANIAEVLDRDGTVEWHAALESGTRYWLLYAGPLETTYTPERRFIFHRLHAEFNALRLDEHLDLTGEAVFDASSAHLPGIFGTGDIHAIARQHVETFPQLQTARDYEDDWSAIKDGGHRPTFHALLDPTPERYQVVYDRMIARFAKWVRQFQGWRNSDNDYEKSVIGFSRWLRGLMLGYEMLRRDDWLTNEQVGTLNAYFVFAARRMADMGRWPHTKTALHPDHPESTRDFYEYGGEHKPDRLYWTNCLPNFQSDPICALAHLAALFPDHPDAHAWQDLALNDIEHQLNAYCGVSGAWEESINYAIYTFSYFIITFKVLKERLGINYFEDARMRRFAGWLVHFLGPNDKRWNRYTFPGVGNAVCPTGGGDYLLCYAGQLAEDDPLRGELCAAYQRLANADASIEHYPTVMAAMAPILDREYPLPLLSSEVMDEVGVSLRHRHQAPNESYLVQKIGFAKDHYEADETAFNWYAKGTPLCMDYGTYTWDAGSASAHNAIEIPDYDPLRRGYLADHLFSPLVDYTHCEVPVVLKLLHGRVRSFAEVDGKEIKDFLNTPYFYIGDDNPVGPKTWKTRLLLFVKPDYLVLFDRVYGDVPHRYCLHVTGEELRRDGAYLHAAGRFDLDLLGFVQHPQAFEVETGELVPMPSRFGEGAANPHRQHWCRLYNHADGIYRTLLFAKERERAVTIESLGACGMRVLTPEYEDLLFLHNDPSEEILPGVHFRGSAGWIRRTAAGEIQACLLNGDYLEAFGYSFNGRGPWTYNMDGNHSFSIQGVPRRVECSTTSGD